MRREHGGEERGISMMSSVRSLLCSLVTKSGTELLPQSCCLLDSLPPHLPPPTSPTSTISLAFSLLPWFLSFILLLYSPFQLCDPTFPLSAISPPHPSSTFPLISISILSFSVCLSVLPRVCLSHSLTLCSTHALFRHLSPPSVNHLSVSPFPPCRFFPIPLACCII